jgi:geranylgeranyl diphosphate synthase, type II
MLPTIPNILNKINKEIDKHEFGNHPAELYEPIKYIMDLGGKRIRPLMTVLSANLFTDDIEKAIKPAIAVEVFHNFTLMHDDIMDKAPLRRGQSTVHEKWNDNTAILSGDVMLVKAYELMSNLDNSILKEAITSFNKCAAEVCEGQQMDMNFEKIDVVTEKEYVQMIKLKTAALLGFSLELGGIIGGTNKKNRELLHAFGTSIGIGFQLMDDLLDVYGDQKKFGKQVGGDIVANKKTFLLIKALETAKKEDLKTLKKYIGNNSVDSDKKVKEITDIYNKSDIRTLTENKINSYFKEGLKNLSEIDAPLYKKNILKNFAKKLLTREN